MTTATTTLTQFTVSSPALGYWRVVFSNPPINLLNSTTVLEIRQLVEQLGDIAGALANADPKLKAQVYDELGIRVTYDPTRRVARIESRPESPWATVRVGGGT